MKKLIYIYTYNDTCSYDISYYPLFNYHLFMTMLLVKKIEFFFIINLIILLIYMFFACWYHSSPQPLAFSLRPQIFHHGRSGNSRPGERDRSVFGLLLPRCGCDGCWLWETPTPLGNASTMAASTLPCFCAIRCSQGAARQGMSDWESRSTGYVSQLGDLENVFVLFYFLSMELKILNFIYATNLIYYSQC